MKIEYDNIAAQRFLHKEGVGYCNNCCFNRMGCLISFKLECAYNITYKKSECEIFKL